MSAAQLAEDATKHGVALCADADPHGTHAVVHALAEAAVQQTRPDARVLEFVGAWPAADPAWAPGVWLAGSERERKDAMWSEHASQAKLVVPGGDGRPLAQRYYDRLVGGCEALRLVR